jgi:hypothetical protein
MPRSYFKRPTREEIREVAEAIVREEDRQIEKAVERVLIRKKLIEDPNAGV